MKRFRGQFSLGNTLNTALLGLVLWFAKGEIKEARAQRAAQREEIAALKTDVAVLRQRFDDVFGLKTVSTR